MTAETVSTQRIGPGPSNVGWHSMLRPIARWQKPARWQIGRANNAWVQQLGARYAKFAARISSPALAFINPCLSRIESHHHKESYQFAQEVHHHLHPPRQPGAREAVHEQPAREFLRPPDLGQRRASPSAPPLSHPAVRENAAATAPQARLVTFTKLAPMRTIYLRGPTQDAAPRRTLPLSEHLVRHTHVLMEQVLRKTLRIEPSDLPALRAVERIFAAPPARMPSLQATGEPTAEPGVGPAATMTASAPTSRPPRANGVLPQAQLVHPATIEAITDQVVRQIDSRMTAWRERTGQF